MHGLIKLSSLFVCLNLLSGDLLAAQPSLKGKAFAVSNIASGRKQNQISQMSGPVAERLAKKLGMTEIQGKPVRAAAKIRSLGKKPEFISLFGADTGIGTDTHMDENEPSIAVKPNNPNVIVAVFHRRNGDFGKVTIGMSRSLNGGQTWSAPVNLPTAQPADSTSDPVVRWAPDGSRIYVTFMSIREDLSTADIVVLHSRNHGINWSKPGVVIPGGDYDADGILDFPDKPWLDVHPFPTARHAKNAVYVTATLFGSSGAKAILLSRSLNKGITFSSSPKVLASLPSTSAEAIQGSRPIGGKNGDVLVCWYFSGNDGWLNGGFDIRCSRSANFGTTFGPSFAAVNNIINELPYFLGPFGQYHRWWGGMFPSLAVLPDGSAHIAFAADPDNDLFNSEEGDIYYARSPRPWQAWSRPARLSDDSTGKAQGYPAITAKSSGRGSALFVAWEDHRNSFMDNELYDIYSDMTLPSFGTDVRVSDISSLSDYVFIGDYIDVSASRHKKDRGVHIIWSDRSDKTDKFDYEDDVYTGAVNLKR